MSRRAGGHRRACAGRVFAGWRARARDRAESRAILINCT